MLRNWSGVQDIKFFYINNALSHCFFFRIFHQADSKSILDHKNFHNLHYKPHNQFSYLPSDKTNKMACAPSEDSDQPGHPPSLIRVFAVCMKKAWILSNPLNASEDSNQTGPMPRLI